MPMREDERKGEKPKKAKTLKEKREELRRKTEAYVKGEEEEEEE